MTIQIHNERCTGCSYCVISCPEDALSLRIEQTCHPVIDTSRCTECGNCIYVCPNNVFEAEHLQPEAQEFDEEYEAVIIGAGIGGLMTAAGLAKAGKKVLVLEQLSFLGGKYTHLMHKGYAISTAAWTCAGPYSRIGKLCTKLGAEIEWVTIHDTEANDLRQGDHWFLTKDGKRYKNLDEAQEDIVGGPKEMHRVHSWIADMYNPSISYPEEMTAREYIQKFVPGNSKYEDYVQTIITYCFASQTVDTFSAMETKRAIVDSIENMANWGTAIGGTEAIIESLAKVVRENGGRIATHTKVNKIEMRDGKACGVTLADGRGIRTDIVVHNAGLNRLMDFVGRENLPGEYTGRLKDAVPANVAALILGTKESLLGEDHSLLHTMGWDPTLNCYAPTYFDPGLAPEGKHALDVFWVMEPPFDHKKELDKVLLQLREVFPDFDEQVEVQIPMFFSGYWTAEMAHRMGQSGAERLEPKTPIPNLYMVGYDCIGYGMAGDIIPHGVEKALYEILGDPLYAPEDEKFSARAGKWFKAQALKVVALMGRVKR